MAHATIEGPTLTPEQEQQKWLGEAVYGATEKAALMHAAIKEQDTLRVMQTASQMLAELRTGMLTPQYYYELYMKVFNELNALEMYFLDQVSSGKSTAELLYSTVQHAGNIVPRLMLLITIGSVFIKTKQAPAKDILQDLIEMSKGVQHPTRGLFVRHYLNTLMKNKLPDVDNEYEGTGGTVIDSATFVLRNFKEMVWLWYRMETKSNIRSKTQRDKERRELRLLIGFNLVRISQLDGVDRAMYQERILPVVLQIILDHREPILQQYLLEVVVQVFPDEFHLVTLKALLEALSGIVSGVNVQSILAPLMDRLGNYVVALRDGTIEEGATKKEEKMIRNMFGLFQEKIAELVKQHNQNTFPASAFAETLCALMKLSLRAYPDHPERVDEVMTTLHDYFVQSGTVDDASAKIIRKGLEFVVDEIKDINIVLDFGSFVGVVGLLSFQTRRTVGMNFIKSAARFGATVGTGERVGKFFDVIAPLVKDVDDMPANKSDIYTIDLEEDFIEEQQLVCKALHLIDTPDLKDLSKLYSGVRKELGKGGPERMRYTLKAMCSLYTRLALKCRKAEVNGESPGVHPQRLFNYLYTGDGGGLLEHLSASAPVEVFYMYLHTANAADTCELGDTSRDLYAAAFALYEEHGATNKVQLQMLNAMIGSMGALRTMSEEEYSVIATKLCQYSSRLVHKADQCRMVMLCSHLFWKKALSPESHTKVVECMKRALKIGDNCPPGQQFGLWAEALNQYAYYYHAQTPDVSAKSVSLVASMNHEAIASAEDKNTDAFKNAKTFFKNTQSTLKKRAAEGDDRWAEVDV